MIATTIPIRTAEGRAELSTRQRRLSQRHRTVLFLVDGRRTAAEVRHMALQAGVSESCFDELLASGLIAGEQGESREESNSALTEPPLEVELSPPAPDSALPEADSMLPPSRSLHPESVAADSTSSAAQAFSDWQAITTDQPKEGDAGFAEARAILLRAVRAEAPLAGSLTMLRLRRARSREDLHELLDEVEARITKPHRLLTTQQTMRRVRHLLGAPSSSLLDFA